MKKTIAPLVLLFMISINCFSQFSADYSSYGFNFIDNKNNDGLNHWEGIHIGDKGKINFYEQDEQNNHTVILKSNSETIAVSYNDHGYMDMNPCTFKVLIRVKVNQFSGSNDALSFVLFTGEKKVDVKFTSEGLKYVNTEGQLEQLTESITIDEWKTYTLALSDCDSQATLMIENDASNLNQLNLPNDASDQSIHLNATSNGTETFISELDHLFIYSQAKKWWLGHSFWFIDDTPAGYEGSTGDRQHFLSFPNGEKIGVNENAGGFVTFTQLTPGGPNLDPNPRFGSGGTKTIRGNFHTSKFNPVQAGISTASGGHLATVNTSDNKIEIESFPLHSFFQEGFIENSPMIYPSGDVLEHHSEDEDVYDEFGLDMRDELMSELDFNSSLENVTKPNGISMVKHVAEWEYIRHPSHILQFHEVSNGRRLNAGDYTGTDQDMGDLRFKFEFRLNKDLGYEWVLWRGENDTWETLNLTAIGEFKELKVLLDEVPEKRFVVFGKSPDPDEPEALAWYYPESETNINGTLSKSRINKEVVEAEDRRDNVFIRADWRKSNWCRMNLYVWTKGLVAPPNKNPNTYESFKMEAIQLFGSANEILESVVNFNEVLNVEDIAFNTTSTIYPNPFTSELTIEGVNLSDQKITIYSVLGQEISEQVEIISQSDTKLRLNVSNLNSGVYFLKVGEAIHKVYK